MSKPVFTFDLSAFLCAVAAAALAYTCGASVPQMILATFLAANFGRSR